MSVEENEGRRNAPRQDARQKPEGEGESTYPPTYRGFNPDEARRAYHTERLPPDEEARGDRFAEEYVDVTSREEASRRRRRAAERR